MVLTGDKIKDKYPDLRYGENSSIGEAVKIGKNVVIGSNTRIGGDVVIGDNCYIGDCVRISFGVRIGSGVKIYDSVDVEWGAIILNNAIIHNSVSIGYQCVICEDVTIFKNAAIRETAIITYRCGGITIEGLYEYEAGFYYDHRTLDIIIRLEQYHRTIEEWDYSFDNNPEKFPKGSPAYKKRLEVYKILKSLSLKIYRKLL